MTVSNPMISKPIKIAGDFLSELGNDIKTVFKGDALKYRVASIAVRIFGALLAAGAVFSVGPLLLAGLKVSVLGVLSHDIVIIGKNIKKKAIPETVRPCSIFKDTFVREVLKVSSHKDALPAVFLFAPGAARMAQHTTR
ncbi:MAG: hypothetical protein HN411_02950 [Waddliaceae bacterium]|nr:hypothetical protein [Waddliaceae bacterium]MBT3578628.1 hypothetical protein [Waddliaceae bacterium]MBT4445347.1 hypothetical protein [Waddliaceae bacterium]MBT6928385.1 hypothetical protein [Waddliaceae bacterium]MBT7265071.1 hypothetical protein [Waddliaceae bacterium]